MQNEAQLFNIELEVVRNHQSSSSESKCWRVVFILPWVASGCSIGLLFFMFIYTFSVSCYSYTYSNISSSSSRSFAFLTLPFTFFLASLLYFSLCFSVILIVNMKMALVNYLCASFSSSFCITGSGSGSWSSESGFTTWALIYTDFFLNFFFLLASL